MGKNMNFQKELEQFVLENGACDVGFCEIDDGDFGKCRWAISVVVRLSDAIIDEITDEPTHTYFNHYRTVNAFIDRLLLQIGFKLQAKGYEYIPVASSQSINKDGWDYSGRYSHKKAAVLSGLGSVGKNSLFLHHEYGARVRLGTIFTDCEFESVKTPEIEPLCSECNLCVRHCPAGAISGKAWTSETKREEIFDPEKCSEHMKNAYQKIGRGAVCGICIKVCPAAVRRK